MKEPPVSEQKSPTPSSSRPSWLTNRVIGGLVIAVLLLLFISVNHEHTEISFIVFSAETSLWIALALAGAAGFLAGYLLGRRRYRQ
jgi:uncharacterized integral membrane protein